MPSLCLPRESHMAIEMKGASNRMNYHHDLFFAFEFLFVFTFCVIKFVHLYYHVLDSYQHFAFLRMQNFNYFVNEIEKKTAGLVNEEYKTLELIMFKDRKTHYSIRAY